MHKTINKLVIFLPIEVTIRELDYKLNLARHFCKAGMEVILGNPPFIRDELKYKNYRAIFLEKGVNPEPMYYEQLSKKGIYLYDMSDEGLGIPYSINYAPAINSLKLMRAIFLWGNSQCLDLIKRNQDKDLLKKYRVIGNPAFDLCTVKYKAFYECLKPEGLPQSYILVNTNFNNCSYSFEEQLKACPAISPITITHIKEGIAKDEKDFRVFIEWLKDIIESFPNEKFVIRPHPVEIEKNYQKLFGHYKNVFISKEGNVNQVIVSAKMVLHKNCTTALQSYLFGIPVISLGGALLNKEESWAFSFGTLPKDVVEAKALIHQVLQNKAWDLNIQLKIESKARNVFDNYLHNIGNATKTLVDFIIKDATLLINDCIPYKLIDSRTKIHKLKLFIRKFILLHYKLPQAARETSIKFTKRDILTRLSLFEVIDPLGIQFSIKKIFPNTFQIRAL